MKKTIFGLFSIATLAGSMFIANAVSGNDESVHKVETVAEVSAFEMPSEAIQINKIERKNDPASSNFTNNVEVIMPEPEPPVKNTPVKHSSNDTGTNKSSSSEKSSSTSSTMFTDNIAGKLADPAHVPCGGLWEYYYDNFYAREIKCNGSDTYLNLNKGDKIQIAGKTCTMVGSQNLNHHHDTMDAVKWIGNTIVQTCYHGNTGKVRLVNFNCS